MYASTPLFIHVFKSLEAIVRPAVYNTLTARRQCANKICIEWEQAIAECMQELEYNITRTFEINLLSVNVLQQLIVHVLSIYRIDISIVHLFIRSDCMCALHLFKSGKCNQIA